MNTSLSCVAVSVLLCVQMVKGKATQRHNESLSDRIVIEIQSTSIPIPQNNFTPKPGNTQLPWPHPSLMKTFSPAPRGSESQSGNSSNALEKNRLPCPVCEKPRHLCFPAISRLTLESGASISMRQLRVGNRVKTLGTNGETTYSEVIAFLHKETETRAQYYKLEISGGNTILLSPQHLIFRKQNSSSSISAIFASEIEPGDLVSNGSDSFDETVIRITVVTQKGVYAPLTLEGTMLVDGVLVSCYASWYSHDAAHLAMAPLRAWRWFSNLMPWRLLQSSPNKEGISWYALVLMTLTGIFN